MKFFGILTSSSSPGAGLSFAFAFVGVDDASAVDEFWGDVSELAVLLFMTGESAAMADALPSAENSISKIIILRLEIFTDSLLLAVRNTISLAPLSLQHLLSLCLCL
jgi:hypothetical protein